MIHAIFFSFLRLRDDECTIINVIELSVVIAPQSAICADDKLVEVTVTDHFLLKRLQDGCSLAAPLKIVMDMGTPSASIRSPICTNRSVSVFAFSILPQLISFFYFKEEIRAVVVKNFLCFAA